MAFHILSQVLLMTLCLWFVVEVAVVATHASLHSVNESVRRLVPEKKV